MDSEELYSHPANSCSDRPDAVVDELGEAYQTQLARAPDKQAEDKRVLLLEDDPVQRQLLTKHLESLNLTVQAVSTIAEAREAIKRRPHLAILDVHLPDGSGLEFCEQIDSDPLYAGLPMIILSSLSAEDMVRRTRASGGCYFLSKPYDPNVLLLVIERALDENVG